MNSILQQLKQQNLVWQGQQISADSLHTSTQFSPLDDVLAGGWPKQGVVQLRSKLGIGELRLLLPALQQRQQQEQRLLAIIAPPWKINGETLAACGFSLDKVLIVTPEEPHLALWSAEQCLKSGCCYACLLWHNQWQVHQVKRLQLAAQQGQAVQFVLSNVSHQQCALPFNMQLDIHADAAGVDVHVHKQRGQRGGVTAQINWHRQWSQLCVPDKPDNVVPLHGRKVS